MRTDPAQPQPTSFDHEHGPERRDVETGRCQLRLCIGFGGWMPCGLPTFQLSSGQYSLRCPNHGGPKRNLSRPREATVAEEVNLSHQTQPPGGDHADTGAMLDCLIDGFHNSVWILAGKDHRTSADLLEHAAAAIHEESESDRRKAKSKARATSAAQARGGEIDGCSVGDLPRQLL